MNDNEIEAVTEQAARYEFPEDVPGNSKRNDEAELVIRDKTKEGGDGTYSS